MGWMVSATVMGNRNSCCWYLTCSCFYKGVVMVISVASTGSRYCTDIFDVAGVDCCKISKRFWKDCSGSSCEAKSLAMFSWSSARLPLWMVYLITATCCSQLCSAACILASRNTASVRGCPLLCQSCFEWEVTMQGCTPGSAAARKGSDSDCRSLWQGHIKSAIFLPPLDFISQGSCEQ